MRHFVFGLIKTLENCKQNYCSQFVSEHCATIWTKQWRRLFLRGGGWGGFGFFTANKRYELARKNVTSSKMSGKAEQEAVIMGFDSKIVGNHNSFSSCTICTDATHAINRCPNYLKPSEKMGMLKKLNACVKSANLKRTSDEMCFLNLELHSAHCAVLDSRNLETCVANDILRFCAQNVLLTWNQSSGPYFDHKTVLMSLLSLIAKIS